MSLFAVAKVRGHGVALVCRRPLHGGYALATLPEPLASDLLPIFPPPFVYVL